MTTQDTISTATSQEAQQFISEQQAVDLLYKNIESSAARDVVTVIIVAAIAIAWVSEKLYVFRQTRRLVRGSPERKRTAMAGLTKDVILANTAHALILKEDHDGIPIILSMAKASKEIVKELKIMNNNLTHLTNHNTEFLADFRKEVMDIIAGSKKQ